MHAQTHAYKYCAHNHTYMNIYMHTLTHFAYTCVTHCMHAYAHILTQAHTVIPTTQTHTNFWNLLGGLLNIKYLVYLLNI